MKKSVIHFSLIAALTLSAIPYAFAQDVGQPDEEEISKALGSAPYSPYAALLAHPQGREWYDMIQQGRAGEAHPFLSPNDEFADYETWDKGNLDASTVKTKEMLEFEYARSALKNGLKLEAKLGTNPYKFGMIGSTDMHTGLAATEEENFFGKTTPQEPSPERMTAVFMDNPENGIKRMHWEVASAGYAAVWAADNTRTAIWDAMYRKETYATTGTRMIVRLFGGWEFNTADTNTRNPAVAGYAKGVPMGGDLSNAPEGKRRAFWLRL